MMRVKICGLMREIDVGFAVLAGADAVGFISGFPASPRNLPLKRAADLARGVPAFVDSVLVTTVEQIKAEPGLRGGRFDSIQLYGEVSDLESIRQTTNAKLIRAYTAKTDDREQALSAAKGFDAVLTDTYVEGMQGGTGMASDWTMCKSIKLTIQPTKLILSGGLNPSNVAAAINAVRPFAVDASSGVETAPGIKDPAKVMEFIKRAKVADW
jgi:phosphoribosylanthranilate isomerase